MSAPATTTDVSGKTGTAPQVDTGAKDLSPAGKRSIMTIGVIVAVIGVALAAAGLAVGGKAKFAPAYLVGFMWATTIGLGGLAFPLIWRVTKAGWPVAARRHMEWLSKFLYVAPLLFIPILLWSHDLYHHWMGPEAKDDPILVKKLGWLNETGFIVRAFIYLLSWALLAYMFRRFSFKQDQTGEKRLTIRAQYLSAPMILILAMTLTFAGFDWVMSLDPHWYSTIYGIYIFAGAAVTSLASVGLISVGLRSRGLMGKILTVEHQHDVGKLFFGFIVFWAYIAFSQYILIWYANIPEETVWYLHRWEHGWKPWSLLLLFGHFVGPFLFMLSRHAKRNNVPMVIGCATMLVMHFVDLYWLVMPTFNEHFSFSWIDIAGLAGPAGILFFIVAQQIAKGPLYPVRDPRVAESMRMENI